MYEQKFQAQDYKNSVFFFLALSACVVVAHWLSRSIPVDLYEEVLAPLQNGATTAICFFGAWLLFRHSEGLRIRKAFGYALMAWGVAETILLLQTFVFHIPVFKNGTEMLNLNGLFVSNLLGWLLLVYPTETLRPRWMTWKHALWQLLPMNRTYLSQLIHAEYGCTFYQFVNRYRIEEAKGGYAVQLGKYGSTLIRK